MKYLWAKSLAVVLACSGGAGAQGVAEYLTCQATEPERQLAIYNLRFPHDRCETVSACNPSLMRSAQRLAREECRGAALSVCEGSEDCFAQLHSYWDLVLGALRLETEVILDTVDRDTLPTLQAQRFEDYDQTPFRYQCDPTEDIPPRCAAHHVALRLGLAEILRDEAEGLR